MILFTSDEHYNHKKIIEYCKRPFSSIEEMNEKLIKNHNEIARLGDTIYHIGDFSFKSDEYRYKIETIISRLRGNHIFINGSHDKNNNLIDPKITSLEIKVQGQVIFLSHYSHRRWPKSHYGSWHLFGHSHGNLEPFGYSFDIGVDSHDFKPWTFDEIQERMSKIIVTEYPIFKNKLERRNE